MNYENPDLHDYLKYMSELEMFINWDSADLDDVLTKGHDRAKFKEAVREQHEEIHEMVMEFLK